LKLENNAAVYRMMILFLNHIYDGGFAAKQDMSIHGVFPELVDDLIRREGNQIGIYPDKDPDQDQRSKQKKPHLGVRGALILAGFAGIVSNEVYREKMATGFLEELKKDENWKKALYAVGIVTFGFCKDEDVRWETCFYPVWLFVPFSYPFSAIYLFTILAGRDQARFVRKGHQEHFLRDQQYF